MPGPSNQNLGGTANFNYGNQNDFTKDGSKMYTDAQDSCPKAVAKAERKEAKKRAKVEKNQ